MGQPINNNTKMMSAKQCAEQLGISVATFYRAVKANIYPQGRRVSVGAVRWSQSDLAQKGQSSTAP